MMQRLTLKLIIADFVAEARIVYPVASPAMSPRVGNEFSRPGRGNLTAKSKMHNIVSVSGRGLVGGVRPLALQPNYRGRRIAATPADCSETWMGKRISPMHGRAGF